MKRTALKRKTGPRHGKPLERRTPLRRGKPLKRGGPLRRRRRQKETAAHKAARLRFEAIVCDRDGLDLCFFADVTEAGEPRRPRHVCRRHDDELDAHHLIEKQWIKRYFGDLPEDELLAIIFDPILGCPLCRYNAHGPVTNRLERIYFEELDDDLVDFCRRIDERYAEPWRPSMLGRLEVECPRRSS